MEELMPEEVEDEFATDPGIKDDYIGTILPTTMFEEGQYGTQLAVRIIAEDGAEVTQFYRCGPDWHTYDGGQSIQHASKTKIGAQSQLQKLTDHAMKCGAEKEIRERSKANGSLGQKTATLWPGLTFHWTVESSPWSVKDSVTGEESKGVTLRAYPDEFIGVDESVLSTESTGSSTTPSDAKEIPADVRAQLVTLANKHDFATFTNHALEIEYVRSNMLSRLSDEGLYNTLKE